MFITGPFDVLHLILAPYRSQEGRSATPMRQGASSGTRAVSEHVAQEQRAFRGDQLALP
jgi:hypothetical protein